MLNYNHFLRLHTIFYATHPSARMFFDFDISSLLPLLIAENQNLKAIGDYYRQIVIFQDRVRIGLVVVTILALVVFARLLFVLLIKSLLWRPTTLLANWITLPVLSRKNPKTLACNVFFWALLYLAFPAFHNHITPILSTPIKFLVSPGFLLLVPPRSLTGLEWMVCILVYSHEQDRIFSLVCYIYTPGYLPPQGSFPIVALCYLFASEASR